MHFARVQDESNSYAEFSQLEDILDAYKQLLVKAFSSTLSLNREPWFFGDLHGTEAVNLLTGQPPGTFLVRFSAHHVHCLSVAYVDPAGDITHALIIKSSLGYHHGDDEIFPTVSALLHHYGTVLVRPFIEPDHVQQLLEEVRAQTRIFLKHDHSSSAERRDSEVCHRSPLRL